LSIGFYVGSYQATRVATSIVAIFAPRLAHFSGTAIGLAGNLVVLLSNSNDETPFIVGTILVGLSETLACMQTYTKSVFDSDLTVLEHKLKGQYAAVMVGVAFAFGLGGFIYQRFGIDGVAIFGVAMSVFELLSLLAYFLLELKPLADESVKKTTDDCTNSSESSQEDDVGKSTFSVRKGDEMVAALDFFLGSDMGANYLNYILCITFGMESITIIHHRAVWEGYGSYWHHAWGWCWIWYSSQYLGDLNQSRKKSHGKIPAISLQLICCHGWNFCIRVACVCTVISYPCH
jgi:hypothetical protein